MKAGAFDYVRAASLQQALALLTEHGEAAALIAGGQSLMAALNLRLASPGILIDIARIAQLRGVALDAGVLRIGALTTHAELLASATVARHAPLIVRAVLDIAHPAIRSRGTIGGSLAHADPAAELPACVLALQAQLVLESPRGRRILPADAFFTGLFETALARDEILTEIRLDPIRPDARWGFLEVARRRGDYAIVGLAAHGTPDTLRLAYFSAGTRPVLATCAAACLRAGLSDAALRAACDALAQDLDPHADLQASAATRLALAAVLLRRVVGGWRPQKDAAA